ncbi:Aminomethyltransferase folate-binding domain-containing protein [Xylariaceae sp. FL1019]|nr:Aminomethyltransferase folate-binding domain-containing protein [Xylariaceae sp. FL1019]
MQSLRHSIPSWVANYKPLSSRTTYVCASCLSAKQQSSRTLPSRQRRSFASEHKSSESSGPTLPPSSGHARLTSRRLISLTGSGAPHFLQGLVTTWIPGSGTPAENKNRESAQPSPWNYCGFLNATGRVLHDVFIYPVSSSSTGEHTFMIEVDADQLPVLLRHVKRYKLRSKISVRAVEQDEYSVWQVWDNNADAANSTGQETRTVAQNEGGETVIRDLRAPGLGYRVLSAGPDLKIQNLHFLQGKNEPSDEQSYRVRRYLRGVPEGSSEIIPEQALPSESNMDIMGGIDFRKGCYVGQELTIRTRHRGVVRKRILPVALYGQEDAVPDALEYNPQTTLVDGSELKGLTVGRVAKKGRSAGTYLAGVGNIGLALCRVQIMTDLTIPNETASAFTFDPTAEFELKLGGEQESNGESQEKGPRIKAFVPEWLRSRLAEEAVKMQAHHRP